MNRWLLKWSDSTVLEGIFRGLRYINESVGSSLGPKLLGSYELEVQNVIRDLRLNSYAQIVDVGCAEGYYLVGLAMLLKEEKKCPKIVGVDISSYAVKLSRELANNNNVLDKVQVYNSLDSALNLLNEDDNTLFIIDVEGSEVEVLESIKKRGYRNSDYIIEVHELLGENDVEQRLLELVGGRRNCEIIYGSQRNREKYIPKGLYPANWRKAAVDEYRKFGLKWMLATRKSLERR